jgi:hypothetical protein
MLFSRLLCRRGQAENEKGAHRTNSLAMLILKLPELKVDLLKAISHL